MKTFLVMGDRCFGKAENFYEAFENWLETLNYDLSSYTKKLTVIAIDCDPEAVSVDQMGGVNYPEVSDVKVTTINTDNAFKKSMDLLDVRYNRFLDSKIDFISGLENKVYRELEV